MPPIEVTKRQAERFQRHLQIAQNRSKGHLNELTPEKEHEVIECIKERLSYIEIQKKTGVARNTVTVLKKKYGFWGA